MNTPRPIRALAALLTAALMATTCSLASAQTVAASPCANGQAIQVKAAAAKATQTAANDAMSTMQSQMAKDAMACVKKVKDLIAAASIHTIDISSILTQIESQLANKACNVVLTTVNNGLNSVTQPINNAIDGSVSSVNNTLNSTIGSATGTTLTGVTTGGAITVGTATGGATTVAPSSTTSTSTWNKLSCAFGGSCN